MKVPFMSIFFPMRHGSKLSIWLQKKPEQELCIQQTVETGSSKSIMNSWKKSLPRTHEIHR